MAFLTGNSDDVFFSDSISNYPSFTPETLVFLGAVAFGSRALNVHTKHSDYDFAILRSTYDKFTEGKDRFNAVPIKDYFKVVPPYGNNTLIKANILNKNYDILLIEHKEHLDIIRKSVQDLKNSSYNLHNKQRRIAMYELALLQNGFKLDWRYKTILWFANLTNVNIKQWIPNYGYKNSSNRFIQRITRLFRRSSGISKFFNKWRWLI